MRVVKEQYKTGKITVVPDDSEDLYVLYNIIQKGDILVSKTTRKVKKGREGSEVSVRISVTMELEVIDCEFHGFSENIRVKGIIKSVTDENIALGSHHSINIELNRQISIIRENWLVTEREMISNSQLGRATGLVILVVDDEQGIVSQVGSHASKILLEEAPTITRKGSDPNQYQQSLADFFIKIISFLRDLKNEGKLEFLIIAGPGFVHDRFYSTLKNSHAELARISQNVSITNSGRNGVREVIMGHLPDRFVENNTLRLQTDLVNQVLEGLGKNNGLVVYASDVFQAAEIGAVENLLVLDTLLHQSVEQRAKIGELMDTVRISRGKVTIMSSEHDSGKIIEGLGNIVALLRYKMPK